MRRLTFSSEPWPLFSGLGESNRDGLFASLHASALAALSAFQCPALAPPHRTFDSLACGLTVFAFAFPFRWHGIPLLQFKTRPDRLGVGPARRLGPGKSRPTRRSSAQGQDF